MHDTELQWLYDTAKKVPEGELIVEIGAWMGRSAAAIYEGAKGKNPVISIDTWQGSPDEPHGKAQEIDLLAAYRENMAALGHYVSAFPAFDSLARQPYYLEADSIDAAHQFPDGSISWWFYDGRHTTTKENIVAWLPKIGTGLVTGHDYFCFYDHIQPAVHQLLHHINGITYSVWVRYWNGGPTDRPPPWY